MSKYQFFCKPNSNRNAFTYLDMSSETYLFEKEELLSSGLEVEGDTIYASSPEEAIDKIVSESIVFTWAGGFAVESSLFKPYIKNIEGLEGSTRGLPVSLTKELIKKVR